MASIWYLADSSDGKHLATPPNSTWTNALEARRFSSSAVEKMNTNNFQDHLAHFRRMEAFYRDRNIVSKLEDGEILFAIIVPKPDNDIFCTHLLMFECLNTLDLDTIMNSRFPFGDQTLLVYQFAANSELKSQRISSFLKGLSELCDYQIIDSLDSNTDLHQPGAIVLFLVTAISNFEVLRRLNYPESTLKIVGYFLTEAEFNQINVTSFRSPVKARLFRLIYPDEFNSSGLIYASHLKVFDTIYARTIRNKFDAIQMGNDIESYTQLDPRSAIADMKEMGWYLRNRGLNHADSFAGGIALRFGKGILVTASYTDKYQIGSDRICYVENYLPERNQVQFVGNFPPSSESALAYLAFQHFPSANLILHFHYKPMTCAPELNHYRTSKYASYGTLAEAEAVVEKLQETDDFAIAYGHGEFVMAPNFADAQTIVDKILSLL